MHEHEGIAWQVQDGIGRIELRRSAQANAIDLPTGRALARAIDAVLLSSPKVVLLSAQGPIFCAGGDIAAFVHAGEQLPQLVGDILEPVHPAIERLASGPAPVVAAVSGPIGGAGVGVALCADFVLASTTMKLRTGYAALGLSPDVGASWFLTRRVGVQRAKQWFMLSDAVDAQQCLEYGAVDALYPPEELAAAAQALVTRLASGARGSLAAIKHLCDGAARRTLAEHLALEHRLLREASHSADAREGIAAFIARRAPQFFQ